MFKKEWNLIICLRDKKKILLFRPLKHGLFFLESCVIISLKPSVVWCHRLCSTFLLYFMNIFHTCIFQKKISPITEFDIGMICAISFFQFKAPKQSKGQYHPNRVQREFFHKGLEQYSKPYDLFPPIQHPNQPYED